MSPGRRRAGLLGALALALVVAGGLVWWYQPFAVVADGRAVGLDEGALDDVEEARAFEVRLPTGTVEVHVGEPLDELPNDLLGTDELTAVRDDTGDRIGVDSLRAPRGSVLVPVWWTEPVGTPSSRLVGSTARAVDPATLSVLVDGEEVATAVLDGEPTFGRDDGPLAAVVDADVPDGPASAISVEVDFDGLTQTADAGTGQVDAGAAAASYAWDGSVVDDLAHAGRAARCRWTADLPAGFSARPWACRVTVVELSPWRRATGWVDEPGQAWGLVLVRTSLDGRFGWDVRREPTPSRERGFYRALEDERRPLLDGVRGEPSAAYDDAWVWLLDEDESLQVTRDVEVALSPEPYDPASPVERGSLTASSTLRAATVG